MAAPNRMINSKSNESLCPLIAKTQTNKKNIVMGNLNKKSRIAKSKIRMKRSLITFRDLVSQLKLKYTVLYPSAESQGLQDLGLGSWLSGRCRCREVFKKS